MKEDLETEKKILEDWLHQIKSNGYCYIENYWLIEYIEEHLKIIYNKINKI
jgi:hypothetical protein